LGHLHDGLLGHLRPTFGGSLAVLLTNLAANCGESLQRQLGDRPLLLGEVGEDRGAVCLAGLEPLRPRTLRDLGRGSERRTAAATLAAVAAGPPFTVAARTSFGAVGPFAVAAPLTTVAALAPLAVTVPVAARSPVAVTARPPTRCAGLDD